MKLQQMTLSIIAAMVVAVSSAMAQGAYKDFSLSTPESGKHISTYKSPDKDYYELKAEVEYNQSIISAAKAKKRFSKNVESLEYWGPKIKANISDRRINKYREEMKNALDWMDGVDIEYGTYQYIANVYNHFNKNYYKSVERLKKMEVN